MQDLVAERRKVRTLACLAAAVLLAAAWFLLQGSPQKRNISASPQAEIEATRSGLVEELAPVPREGVEDGAPALPGSAEPATSQAEEERPADAVHLTASAPASELGSLEVEVVDADGSPLPGAAVGVHPGELCVPDPYKLLKLTETSDDRGRVTFKNLSAGAWHVGVVADRPFLMPLQAHAEAAVEDAAQGHVVVRVDDSFVIAGRVRVPEGHGFDHVVVDMYSDLTCGYWGMVVEADGSFRAEGLCRGPWRCYAKTSGWSGVDQGWGLSAFSSIDSVLLASSASVLVAESREDLELVLTVASTLSGRFVGLGDGRRLGVAINRDTNHRYALRFDHQAFSALGLDPGTYLILGTNMQGWAVLDGLRVEAGSALTGLEIAIEPTAECVVTLPSQPGRTSVFLGGVQIPDVRAETGGGLLVPAGQLQVEAHFGGSRHVQTVEAIGGQKMTLSF